MQKIQSMLFILALATMSAFANPTKVASDFTQTYWVEEDDITYGYDQSTEEANIAENYDEISDLVYYYSQTNFVVLSTVTLPIQSASMSGGPSSGMTTFKVVELGERSFENATCSTITFAAPSYVRAIRTRALINMSNMTTKLTLPASLEHLDISSIVLPKIQEIEFLGTVPPTCDVNPGNKSAYNPWTESASNVTPSNIKVTVPVGSEEAYKGTAGIGDYFDCFKTGGSGTGIAETIATQSHARKVIMNGQMYILRDGHLYNALGAQVN
ncbi:MAG: hypothetical protein J6T32_02060 [Paludibacteraceae bacterium]|nr:hypothetical protein [Paludibacteraceae bacterium]